MLVASKVVDELDDAELFARWRGGDDVAGNALVRRHFDTIHRFFAARFDRGVTDLVQRCFLGAVQAKERLPDGLSFKAYLLGIAHRQMLMAWRTQRRHDAVFAAGSVSAPEQRSSPSAVVARREEQRVLIRALRSLAIEQQSLLELFYWEELGIDEIAAILEIPAGTVKSRLHRARALLRDAIDRMELAPDLLHSTVQNLEGWARSLKRSTP
ncbi:MAG TPA: sigma-70 family RNA polymerase sigma factor [Nannocystaceae bacterium]|nr:sigma-70 family RNA polymerase sigma factor [Nannocystaceae bacterium]